MLMPFNILRSKSSLVLNPDSNPSLRAGISMEVFDKHHQDPTWLKTWCEFGNDQLDHVKKAWLH